MSGDSWLLDYDTCTQLGQKIMEKVMERNRESKGSTVYVKLSATIRTSLRQFSSELSSLQDGLIRANTRRFITERECERRQRLLDELVTKEKQLDIAFKNDMNNDSNRGALLNPVSSGFGVSPWTEETEETVGWSNAEIRQRQENAIKAQDEGLDALSSVISRQKQMAIDIGNEVETQNEIIDDITVRADRTNQRLLRETRHIKIIDRKSSTCCLWIVIVLLLIAIVVVAVVPFHNKP